MNSSLVLRIHFWAAAIASPFALIAVLTGILYVFTPQIEARLYNKLDHITPTTITASTNTTMSAMRSLDDAVVVAKAAAPAGWRLHSVAPAYSADDTVKINFVPPAVASTSQVASMQHDEHMHGLTKAVPAAPRPSFGLPAQTLVVYVDPYKAEIVGKLSNQDRFGNWAKKLHSRLLQNESWRWMIELAASCLMVMLLTGVYLWWPRDWRAALPQTGLQGRASWRQWHAFLGVVFCLISLVMLTTGLTWSKYAGGQIRILRDSLGQASPQVPHHLQSIVPTNGNGAMPLTWQAVWDAARNQVPDVPLQLFAPRGPQGTWRVNAVDRGQPERRFDMVLDAYSGQKLYYAGWAQQTAFGKATGIGIPFHRGEFGWWNQALLFMFGISTLFSLISGWVMFFKRRQSGSLGLPSVLPGSWKSVSIAAWLFIAVLLVAMPLLVWSVFVVLIVEVLMKAGGVHIRTWKG